jgi:hypothetical protein
MEHIFVDRSIRIGTWEARAEARRGMRIAEIQCSEAIHPSAGLVNEETV